AGPGPGVAGGPAVVRRASAAMMPVPAHELQQSQYRWRGALVACALNAIGMPLDILVGRDVPGMPKWPSLMSGVVGLLLAGALLVRRRHPTYRLGAAGVLLQHALHLCALWGDH